MKCFLLIPMLALTTLAGLGCSNEHDETIQACVPGGDFGQSNSIDVAGTYTLYHVTEFDRWGAPTKAEKIYSTNLPVNAHVGFEYVVPKDKTWYPDAQSEVVAYAGSTFRRNLGPIHSINEKYYWANPNDWDGFWATRPEKILTKRALQY